MSPSLEDKKNDSHTGDDKDLEKLQQITRGHVKEYLRHMQYSGYAKEFRAQVVESAMKVFDVMLDGCK